MTCSTICAELTLVDILRGMTGEAIFGRIFVNPIHMAGLAVHILVRTCQLEPGHIVIELSRFPGVGSMAVLASRAKLTHMWVDLLMARKAIQGRTFINAVQMTLFACHLDVSAIQFELGAVMVKV